ncbi:MAG: sigma-70 family RNA polymerase sigma factor [Lachnospiraceae bacterium]|nr:sigma-70 family RNA polymerase sigma factor [Lachnospiraceae bacterium]
MKVDYQKLTDEQLVDAYQQGSKEAGELLFGRYKDMVRKKCKSMYLVGGDHDDLIQEGMIGLLEAVHDYAPDYGASFATFASMCINRNLITAIAAANRQKNQILNEAYSFYEPGNVGEDGECGILMDNLEDVTHKNPETTVLEQQELREWLDLVPKILSKFEYQVFVLYLGGMDYVEIARDLEKSPKSIDNALHRIKKKLQNYPQEQYDEA